MRRPWLFAVGCVLVVFLGGSALMVNDYLGWGRGGFVYYRPVFGFGVGLACVALGWWPARPAARAFFGLLGAAALVYGVASLAGGWLGTAPWQWRRIDVATWVLENPGAPLPSNLGRAGGTVVIRDAGHNAHLSVVVMGVGVTLLAVALWPRYVSASSTLEP